MNNQTASIPTSTAAEDIAYSWLDQYRIHRTGTWEGDPSEAIAAGAAALGAEDHPDHGWVYLASEICEHVAVDGHELAALGAALLAGHPMGECYSIWCCESMSSVVDLDDDDDEDEPTTDDQIQALAAEAVEAGDTEGHAICLAALAGDDDARSSVATMIAAAAAMDDGDEDTGSTDASR